MLLKKTLIHIINYIEIINSKNLFKKLIFLYSLKWQHIFNVYIYLFTDLKWIINYRSSYILTFHSYSKLNLKTNVSKIIQKLSKISGVVIKSIRQQKSKLRKYTVLRSPFVYKKSQEQFFKELFKLNIIINFDQKRSYLLEYFFFLFYSKLNNFKAIKFSLRKKIKCF